MRIDNLLMEGHRISYEVHYKHNNEAWIVQFLNINHRCIHSIAVHKESYRLKKARTWEKYTRVGEL